MEKCVGNRHLGSKRAVRNGLEFSAAYQSADGILAEDLLGVRR
jgi:hypothetical protein